MYLFNKCFGSRLIDVLSSTAHVLISSTLRLLNHKLGVGFANVLGQLPCISHCYFRDHRQCYLVYHIVTSEIIDNVTLYITLLLYRMILFQIPNNIMVNRENSSMFVLFNNQDIQLMNSVV